MAIAAAQERNTWFAFHKIQQQVKFRLFCLPYSGGGASVYHSWEGILPPTIEIIPIELPGRGSRMIEPPYTHIDDLVQDLSAALLPYLDRPFAFFGHSMGALVGFEISRHLRDAHCLFPFHLFISGHGAPHIQDREKSIHELSDEQLVEKLREMNGTQEEILNNPELRSIILPVIRADFSICGTYRYRPAAPLSCPMDIFGGLGDRYVPRCDLEAWAEHTSSACKVRMFPGDHFFLNQSRLLLLRVIAQELFALMLK
jgi:medium-chain acyl-[acyl-carrier-protein] hydrolase